MLSCRQYGPNDCFNWRCTDQICVLENSLCCSGEARPGVVLGMPPLLSLSLTWTMGDPLSTLHHLAGE